MKFPRRKFLHLAASAAALPAILRVAMAQTYPTRPITIVVGYPAGGPTDALARVLAEQIKGALGQIVVIDRRPGANGTVGAVSVVNAAPDGHTLLITPNVLTSNPYLQKNFPFHPLTALAPISVAAETSIMLAVHPSVPANNVAELVEHARKNPGRLSYGSAGVGSGHHLAGELLKQRTGIDITHIPYRGIVAAVQDLVAGHIPISFGGPNTFPQHVAAGKIRILAVVEDKRSADFPDIPTIAETYPGVTIPVTWFGLLAPSGTPRPVIEMLSHALAAALRNPVVIARLKQQGQLAVAEGPEAFTRRIQEEFAVYARLIPSIGIQLE